MTANVQKVYAFQSAEPSAVYRLDRHSRLAAPRVIVGTYECEWWQHLKARFNELTALPVGWDGYRGMPVSFDCAVFAASLLERICIPQVSEPSLVPGSDGTVQIEWHQNQYDVEIDVLGPNNVVATRYDHVSDQEEVLNLKNEFSVLVLWMNDLATQRVQVAAASA